MSEPMPENVPIFEKLCDAFRHRLGWLLFRMGSARVLALGAGLFAILALLDWQFHFQSPVRIVAFAGFLLAIGIAVWSMLVEPLRKKWSNQEILGYLDNVLPQSQGLLLDYYELASSTDQIQETETELGRQLVAQSAANAASLASQVSVGQALDKRKANSWLVVVLCFGFLLVLTRVTFPSHLKIGAERFFNPLSNTRWPHCTDIVIAQPENGWTVPQLESFDVNATVTGDVPAQVTLAYRSGEAGYWIRERLDVANKNGVHTVNYAFPEVREPIEFYLEGGDYTSDRFEVAIIRRPYLKSITAHYAYPSYAGVPNTTRNSGQISGLEGTEVTLDMECSIPLQKAVLVLELDENKDQTPERVGLALQSKTRLRHTLLLRSNGRYTVELYDENGYREPKPEVYEIRVTPDDPPEVELLSPGRDLVETRNASIDVAFQASDKLGLKQVQFLYQIDDDPQEHLLSDHHTGPIAQTGNNSHARFTWQLQKMGDDLPDDGKLSFFIRVQDNNPTGRGVRQSKPASIRLVKPSEFHLDAIERAKLLEEEARIAWRNQLHAWQLGGEWLQSGTGEQDDELWINMQTAQEKSFQATSQIQFHLETLSEKYERNHMSRDFMSGRLSVIAQLLTRLQTQEQAAIKSAFEKARPKIATEAEPNRLKATRTLAMQLSQNQQKMAVLVLERMLRKLYDWRDLQNCTITTKLLYEQQDEVCKRTTSLAPKTIAKEIEDLADEDQEQLLTLGKQQRAIFDTETGLENQLTYLTYKAERQQRNSIRVPLQAAWGNLRNQRVNDYLKRAADLIANNQPAQILKDQTAAIRALRLVEEGLLVAGQKVDADEPLTLTMTPSEEKQFDPDLIKPDQTAEVKPNQTPTEVDPVSPSAELTELPEGTDPLSAGVRRMIELQDNVLARTRYLSKNNSPAEMPRFIKLKVRRLTQRQEMVLAQTEKTIEEAKKLKNQPAVDLLQVLQVELNDVRTLLVESQVNPVTQQIQSDAIETMRNLLQYLAMEKAALDVAAENKRLGGKDAFGRPYVLQEQNLLVAVKLLLELNHARQWLSDALRKLDRFKQHPAKDETLRKLEQLNRTRASNSIATSATLINNVDSRIGSLSEDAKLALRNIGVDKIGALPLASTVDPIAKAEITKDQLVGLNEANQTLLETIQSLRDLLEERVKPAPDPIAEEKPAAITPEEFAKLTSREHLAEKIKNDADLPPKLKQLMLQSLEQQFPEKYRDLLKAYYGSFVKP